MLLRPAVQAGLLLPLIPQHTPLPTPTPTILLIWAPARLTGIEVLFPWCPWLSQGLPACLFSTEAGAQSHHVGPQRPCQNSLPFLTKPGAYTPHLPELKPLHTLGLTNNPPRENESWGAQTASVNRFSTKDRHMWDIRLWINKMGTFVSVSSPKWSNLGLRAKSSETSSIFLLQFIIFLWITGDREERHCLSRLCPSQFLFDLRVWTRS